VIFENYPIILFTFSMLFSNRLSELTLAKSLFSMNQLRRLKRMAAESRECLMSIHLPPILQHGRRSGPILQKVRSGSPHERVTIAGRWGALEVRGGSPHSPHEVLGEFCIPPLPTGSANQRVTDCTKGGGGTDGRIANSRGWGETVRC
jgi:hypothetical protein